VQGNADGEVLEGRKLGRDVSHFHISWPKS